MCYHGPARAVFTDFEPRVEEEDRERYEQIRSEISSGDLVTAAAVYGFRDIIFISDEEELMLCSEIAFKRLFREKVSQYMDSELIFA